MKKIIAFFILFGGLIACKTENPFAPTSVEKYLNELVDFMEQNHINKNNIDWVDLRAQVQQKGSTASTIAGADESIKLALQLLDDKNSFVLTARGNILDFRVTCSDTKPPDVPTAEGIGYVKIPPYSNFGLSAAIFAEKMHGTIRDQDKTDLKGWIVDLRENTGGNLWPMIAGIGPILGVGTAGYFITNSGTKTPFGYKVGSSTYNEENIVTVSFPYTLVSPNSKVAVLVDHSTTNAGEAVAVAFSGKTLSRSFGAATCGQGGGNQPFRLSDGSVLYLAVAYLADRNEVNKQGVLQPDEVVGNPDQILNKAVEWINQ